MLETDKYDLSEARMKGSRVMNTVSGVSGATSGAAATSLTEQAINMLQAQMLRYQAETGAPPGSVDFKALQYAIDTGNIVGAQAALARLHRDSQAPAAATPTPQPSAPPPPIAPTSSPSVSASQDVGTDGSSIDATA